MAFADVAGGQVAVGSHEQQKFQEMQQQCDADDAELRPFRQTYQARLQEVRPMVLAQPGRGGGRRKRGRGHGGGAVREVPDGELSQAQLAPLCPLGGHIWRGNNAESWSSHMAPFKRASFSWHLYGHREAAIFALRDMWRKALALEGKSESDCPVRNLFTVEASVVPAPKRRA